MSLKAFHIAFITISTLLALGLSLLAFQSFAENHNGLLALAGIAAAACAAGLVLYGVRFLKKLRHVSFL